MPNSKPHVHKRSDSGGAMCGRGGKHPRLTAYTDEVTCTYCALVEQEQADAEFIAAARTAMPLLLGAVIAVLEDHRPGRIAILGRLCRHHENHRYFSITSTEADGVRACPDCTATVYSACTGCGQQVSADACPVRSAIGRELAGKDSSDGQ